MEVARYLDLHRMALHSLLNKCSATWYRFRKLMECIVKPTASTVPA